MVPEPVTQPENDTGRRAQSVGDLEVTLVGFIQRLFSSARLDNPTLNLSQATGPEPLEPRIVRDPDEPPVSYDPTERAQTLALKVPPRVVRGRIPRTVTGEIDADKLPDCPAVIVQAVMAKIENDCTHVTVRILLNSYDENPASGGYQDVQNMSEALWQALTSYGQQGLDRAYPIQMPIEWKLVEPDTFPHYIGEMTTVWELPSARPLPDPETIRLAFIPAEHIELRGESFAVPIPGVKP